MDEKQQYQALLYIRKKIQMVLGSPIIVIDEQTTGLCEYFEYYCRYHMSLLRYQCPTFMEVYKNFIIEFLLLYPDFFNKIYLDLNFLDLSFREAPVEQRYKKVEKSGLAHIFWWERDREGYERRLQFIKWMIKYYHPENKKSVSEIIKKNG